MDLPKPRWLLFLCFIAVVPASHALDEARQQTLKHLLVQDCGSCHGLWMKGGLGPALTPEALAGKSREYLVGTVIHGRPGTAMPPWKALLSEEEAGWMIDRLLQGVEP